MRYQGKITSWDKARGFGFIEWNGGNDKVFVHISAFSERPHAVANGDIVTYEVTKDEKGRHQAVKVAFPNTAPKRAASKPHKGIPWFKAIGFILIPILATAGFMQYKKQVTPYSHPDRFLRTEPVTSVQFQCRGKTHCSQMTSCEEATFYLRHCPGTEMDGDADGIPCESQWCAY